MVIQTRREKGGRAEGLPLISPGIEVDLSVRRILTKRNPCKKNARAIKWSIVTVIAEIFIDLIWVIKDESIDSEGKLSQ